MSARLFQHKAPIGPRMEELIIQSPLRTHIGFGYEIGWPFAAHLQMFDFAKVTAQPAARLARSASPSRAPGLENIDISG